MIGLTFGWQKIIYGGQGHHWPHSGSTNAFGRKVAPSIHQDPSLCSALDKKANKQTNKHWLNCNFTSLPHYKCLSCSSVSFQKNKPRWWITILRRTQVKKCTFLEFLIQQEKSAKSLYLVDPLTSPPAHPKTHCLPWILFQRSVNIKNQVINVLHQE